MDNRTVPVYGSGMTIQEQVTRAQALWLRVRAGDATAAERAEYDALKASAYRRMRRDGS